MLLIRAFSKVFERGADKPDAANLGGDAAPVVPAPLLFKSRRDSAKGRPPLTEVNDQRRPTLFEAVIRDRDRVTRTYTVEIPNNCEVEALDIATHIALRDQYGLTNYTLYAVTRRARSESIDFSLWQDPAITRANFERDCARTVPDKFPHGNGDPCPACALRREETPSTTSGAGVPCNNCDSTGRIARPVEQIIAETAAEARLYYWGTEN